MVSASRLSAVVSAILPAVSAAALVVRSAASEAVLVMRSALSTVAWAVRSPVSFMALPVDSVVSAAALPAFLASCSGVLVVAIRNLPSGGRARAHAQYCARYAWISTSRRVCAHAHFCPQPRQLPFWMR